MRPSLPLLILAALFIQSAYGRDGNNRNTGKYRLFWTRNRLNIGQPLLSDAILNKWSIVATTTTSTEKPVIQPPPEDIEFFEYTYPTYPSLEPSIKAMPQPALAPIVQPVSTSSLDALYPAVYATKEEDIAKKPYKEDKGADEDDEYDEYIFGLMPNTSENEDKDLIEFNDPALVDPVSRSRLSRWRRRQQLMARKTKRTQMANKRRHAIKRRRSTNGHNRRIHRRMTRIDSQKPCTQLRRHNHVFTETL